MLSDKETLVEHKAQSPTESSMNDNVVDLIPSRCDIVQQEVKACCVRSACISTDTETVALRRTTVRAT